MWACLASTESPFSFLYISSCLITILLTVCLTWTNKMSNPWETTFCRKGWQQAAVSYCGNGSAVCGASPLHSLASTRYHAGQHPVHVCCVSKVYGRKRSGDVAMALGLPCSARRRVLMPGQIQDGREWGLCTLITNRCTAVDRLSVCEQKPRIIYCK